MARLSLGPVDLHPSYVGLLWAGCPSETRRPEPGSFRSLRPCPESFRYREPCSRYRLSPSARAREERLQCRASLIRFRRSRSWRLVMRVQLKEYKRTPANDGAISIGACEKL